ncbi:mevalonate kinase [Polyangium sp. y55x31]|uniref:mevalonate kinase n=1 Tax=Polyangium sp. y55x31 TaxID=3042688 RepID=UPI002482D811|nr:mevalonate kinase [Polyangium sp. y55x31]MDI1475663.1 mevalonate kinase [Polyangium sp. y55x31]
MTGKASAEGSASGKVILFGEHAVVYGSPAIAAGLDRGARAVVTRLPAGPSTLKIGDGTVVADASSSNDLGRAFFALLEVAPAIPPVHVEARCDLPPGGGLGSSAALAVSIARAAETLVRGDEVRPEEDAAIEARVLARAAAWERIFHGNPSGIDATAAARGGIFRFTRAEGARSITPRQDLVLCVGSTGQPSSTKTTVELIASQHAKDPALVKRSIDAVTSIVGNAVLAIEAGDMRALGDLMNMNQLVLSGLFVSTSEIEELCGLARSAGALGAKLTGGGGGGCVIALVPPSFRSDGTRDEEREAESAARILDAWRSAEGHYEGFCARIGAGRRAETQGAEGGLS